VVNTPTRLNDSSLLSPLADASFRQLWLSSTFFFSGFWAQTVVLGWLAFELTDSEFAVAAFTAARFAPMLIGPLGGMLADRLDRPRVLRASVTIAFAIGVVIAGLATFGEVAFWQVLIAGLLIGSMQSPLQPARFTLIMDLVGPQRLSSANGLNMAALFGSRIIAPALAGWVIAEAGADSALWFSAAWYVPALLFLLPLREPARSTRVAHGVVADLVEGFRYAVTHRGIATVLLASIAANLFAWPVIQGFMPVFAEDVYDVGAVGLGVLVAANGVGALAGALAIAGLGDFARKGRVFLGATAGFGVILTLLAVVDQIVVGVVLMFLAGAAGAGFGVLQSTLILLQSPDEMRGRVTGVLMLSIGVLPFALLVQGAAAARFGVPATTLVAGALLAASIVTLSSLAPELWRLGSEPRPAERDEEVAASRQPAR
jgi:MFS family permease